MEQREGEGSYLCVFSSVGFEGCPADARVGKMLGYCCRWKLFDRQLSWFLIRFHNQTCYVQLMNYSASIRNNISVRKRKGSLTW